MILQGTGCYKTYTIREGLFIDFIYAAKTYSSEVLTNPEKAAETEEYFINNAKEAFNRIWYTDDVPLVVLPKYQIEFPDVLKTRVCIAQLSLNSKLIGVIWFDDGDKDIMVSLDEIFDEIDWSLSV